MNCLWHIFHQFSLQQCVNVQIPKSLQGLGGAAVFIDTNRGFSIDRIKSELNYVFVDGMIDKFITLNFVLITFEFRYCWGYA